MKQTLRRALLATALVAMPSLATVALAEEAASEKIMPVLTLDGDYPEAGVAFSLFGDEPEFFRDLLADVRAAAKDEDVAALGLKMESPEFSLAQLAALQRELLAFRESGKPIVSVSDSYSLGKYVLASAGTEIVLTPVGGVDIYGMSFDNYYFKGLLDKLGVGTQVVNTGKFKNAYESFTHDKMSEGTKIQMGALLDDLSGWMVERVAEGRGIEPAAAADMLWRGPYLAEEAKELGMVTTLGYPHDFLEDFASSLGAELDWDYSAKPEKDAEPFNLFTFFNPPKKGPDGKKGGDRIAVVYALGGISDGRAESGPFSSGEQIASEDFIDLLDEVDEDGTVKALVLRVDSPGGSAIASDRIWNRINAFKDAGVPVVVSMGGVAASGGYYISMNADHIIAEPTTITGSIGVIGGRVVLGDVYEKMGVTKDALRIGKFAGIMDESKRWEGEEAKLIEESIEEIYDVFTAKAAAGRGMEQDAIKELGGGRVWTGIAAKKNGLVDDLGGLDDAIAKARELASADDKMEVVYYPREKTLSEMIQEMIAGDKKGKRASAMMGAAIAAQLPIVMPESLAALERALPAQARETFWTTLTLLNSPEPQYLMYHPQAYEIRY